MSNPGGLLPYLLTALAQRRLAMGALAVTVVVLGALTLTQMPLQLLPDIRYPHIRIIGDMAGQTSRVIEESINEPFEAALFGVPGLVQMQSRAGDGRAYIELFFEPGYDLDRGLRDVTQAAQRALAQVPPDMPPPRIFEVSTTEQPALEFAFGSSTLPAAEIRQRLRSQVLPRLRAIPGVDAVYMGYEDIAELVIDIDPARQSAMGVSLDAIELALLRATGPPLSSSMRSARFDGVGVLGSDTWNEKYLLDLRLLVNGGTDAVPLSSVAGVRRAASEEGLRTRLNGHAAVQVTVFRSANAHSLRLARQVQAVLADVAELQAFADIQATTLYDDSVVTRSAVQSVLVAAAGGSALAMFLLCVALRDHRRYVPLVAMVVAVSLSATVIVLHAMGHSLNLLTLAGLLLSVGLGLDYAIIYFDRMDRIRGRVAQAHLQAMTDVIGPLFAALLTTLAAVVPFLFVKGLIALLFKPLIWTVIIAGVFSFVFALALLPAFARTPAPSPAAPVPVSVPLTAREAEAPTWWRYSQRPVVVWSLAAALVAVFVWGARELPFEVLPVIDDGFVDLRITHPVGISADDMDRLARRVEDSLMATDGTAVLFTTVGGYFRQGMPAFRPATTDFMVRVATDGSELSSAEWARRARSAFNELAIPDLRLRVTLPRIRGVRTRLADAAVVVVLTSADGDLLTLGELEPAVVEQLEAVHGLIDIERMRGGVSPRWVARPRYDVLGDHAIEPEALRQVLSYALEGRVLRQRMYNGEPLVLRARYDRRHAGGAQHLDAMRVRSALGGEVHLGDVVDFALVEEPTHIERREGQRVVRIAGELDPAGPGPAEVAAGVSRAMAAMTLPAGVGWWLEGEVDALEETRQTFAVALVLALGLVLMLLIVQYGSLAYAMAGLVSIVLSGAGTILLLTLMGRPLDAMVLAGVLIAVGIVANNVILVASQAQEMTAGPDRLALAEALRRAARDRFRPIVLTVLSTVVGISPLLLGGAEVFGLLQPLAIALTGTLLVSIPVACLLLPGIILSFARLTGHGARRAV